MTSILELPHGIHTNVPDSIYHQRVPGLASKHALDKLRRSPAHYKTWLDGAVDKETEALKFGKAFDCALLEPERFDLDYVVEPDFGDCRFKEAKASKALWRETNKGLVWIDDADHRACVAMAKAIRAHGTAGPLLSRGSSQVTLRWRDAATGIECKARLDHHRPDLRAAVDVKTAENAGDLVFAKACANFGYHRQAAFYEDGLAALGAPIDVFVFVAVEKEPPYAVATYVLDTSSMNRGRASVREDLDVLSDRVLRDCWDAYPQNLQILTLPPWAA